jgi:acyl-CoA thioesterase-1
MNYLIFHFVSGKAFFTGSLLLILAGTILFWPKNKFSKIISLSLSIVGITCIVLSATPLPVWFYGLWFVIMMIWLLLDFLIRNRRPKCSFIIRIAFILYILIMVFYEANYYRTPSLAVVKYQKIFVIGDSISAGIGKNEKPWPAILSQTYKINMVNLAQAGATVESALDQVTKITEEVEEALVILEIGGNNLISRLPTKEFEKHLEKLLTSVWKPNRIVIMLELPLFPFCNSYGRIQRDLARQYDVFLVPKHLFADILKTDGTTTDGVHLTAKGQELIANMIWSIISNEEISQ